MSRIQNLISTSLSQSPNGYISFKVPNDVTRAELIALATCIHQRDCISYLDLAGTKLDNHAIILLVNHLQKAKNLRGLNLSANPLAGTDGASQLEGAYLLLPIITNPNLKKLVIGKTTLRESAWQVIASTFLNQKQRQLQELDLHYSRLNESFFCWLAADKHLQILNLNHCSFAGEAFKNLGESLRQNRCLLQLSLAQTQIDFQRMQLLFVGLCGNNTLQTLDLSGNRVHGRALQVLFQALAENVHLQSLDLRDNMFVASDAPILIAGLKNNYSILDLRIGDVGWSAKVIQTINVIIRRNQSVFEAKNKLLRFSNEVNIYVGQYLARQKQGVETNIIYPLGQVMAKTTDVFRGLMELNYPQVEQEKLTWARAYIQTLENLPLVMQKSLVGDLEKSPFLAWRSLADAFKAKHGEATLPAQDAAATTHSMALENTVAALEEGGMDVRSNLTDSNLITLPTPQQEEACQCLLS